MAHKKLKLRYKKERVVLSDVLPYEVPLTFSNRHFYHFIVSNKIEFSEGKIEYQKGDDALDTIVSLIFGMEPNKKNHSVLFPLDTKLVIKKMNTEN